MSNNDVINPLHNLVKKFFDNLKQSEKLDEEDDIINRYDRKCGTKSSLFVYFIYDDSGILEINLYNYSKITNYYPLTVDQTITDFVEDFTREPTEVRLNNIMTHICNNVKKGGRIRKNKSKKSKSKKRKSMKNKRKRSFRKNNK
jgi:hypothetical protein